MSDDLIERLRSLLDGGAAAAKACADGGCVECAERLEAADEIERLQAEVLYLRQMAQGLAHEEWGETLEPLFAKRLMAAVNGARCDTCKGTGRTLWGDSAMGSGIGGQTITYGPCPGTNRSAANSNCPVWLAESDGA